MVGNFAFGPSRGRVSRFGNAPISAVSANFLWLGVKPDFQLGPPGGAEALIPPKLLRRRGPEPSPDRTGDGAEPDRRSGNRR